MEGERKDLHVPHRQRDPIWWRNNIRTSCPYSVRRFVWPSPSQVDPKAFLKVSTMTMNPILQIIAYCQNFEIANVSSSRLLFGVSFTLLLADMKLLQHLQMIRQLYLVFGSNTTFLQSLPSNDRTKMPPSSFTLGNGIKGFLVMLKFVNCAPAVRPDSKSNYLPSIPRSKLLHYPHR